MRMRIRVINPGQIVGLLIALLVPACRHAGPAAGSNDGSSSLEARTSRSPLPPDDDPFAGWFAEGEGRVPHLVPVFQRGGTYYSTCRGFEIPFKRSPEGLEWDVVPSGMTGTTIGFDPATGARYLAVFDYNANMSTAGVCGIGEKKPLVRTERPAWVRDPTADPPQSLDDLLGWYEMVWFPMVRWEIFREGDAYIIAYAAPEQLRSAAPESYRHELKPLPDRLGLGGFDRDNPDQITLIYNEYLRRFELCQPRNGQVRAPLARIARPTATSPAGDVPNVEVGIPSWH